MKFFKILFSLVFLVLSTLWVLFAAETLMPDKINIFSNWDWFQNDILLPVNEITASNGDKGKLGYEMLLYSGAILLVYNSIVFIIQKIPIVGPFIKSITGFVSFFSVIAIVIGCLLWTGVIV